MDALDIVVEDDRWHALDLERLATATCTQTLRHLGIASEGTEVTLLACGDARIAALNADFRGKPTATNVLSWPAHDLGTEVAGGHPQAPRAGIDGMRELGDIALSFDTIMAEAAAAGRPPGAHVTHLIIHGLLHLLGYDHENDPDAALMEAIEVEILGKMGHDDPYTDS